jgi:hypothetical protein
MDRPANQKPVKPPRVVLTDPLRRQLMEKIRGDSISGLARRTGLPYLLIYNIVRQRIKSLSARHFRLIFGQSPPVQVQRKTDGTHFREMVALWLFLNDSATKAGLYREYYGPVHTKRVDYRIFSGQTGSVDPGLIRHMEQKFAVSGIDPETVRHWADEFARWGRETLIEYSRVRPLVQYLNHTLGVHPTTVLNQWSARYESGDLKKVSPKVYHRILNLKAKAEKALASGSRLKVEKLKEEIYGRKSGYTLYSEIAEELKFLREYAHKSAKKYLGRSTSMYTRGECKRLPSWRARKIIADCRAFVRQQPHLPLLVLPRAIRKPVTDNLLALLQARIADLLSREDGIVLEKKILAPAYASAEYKKQIYGFTQFDMAGKALGMKKKAFDLMVAENCEIFRKIGTYSRRWYLSDLYLKELSRKQYFHLITTKYEWLARKAGPHPQANACMN